MPPTQRETYSGPLFSTFETPFRSGLPLAADLPRNSGTPRSPTIHSQMTSTVTPCPYRAQFLKEGGDPAATAKGIIGTMRTWSNSSFLTALSESRPMAERVALVDEFYGRYEKEIATDPSKHHMDYVHHYVTIEKV